MKEYMNNRNNKHTNQNKKKNNNRGVTLIALTVTIIVIFILSAISISMVREKNGTINETFTAKNIFEREQEREAIQQVIAYNAGGKTADPNYFIGIPLVDRNAEGADTWQIVVVDNSDTVYGSNWNYIEIGTNLYDYGETKYSWVANYYTGEVEYLDGNIEIATYPDGKIYNVKK